ncbi:unnamed protein product [Protopolystoma xenopodis]|uniref:MIR domain-containing protein n=1 Tax=Protopolystoma xenopodis TaxID=117903 RepID=A0A448WGP0_9PLAT|nr:unnamed protein product [Protopolystoma xenopodis]
MYGIGSASGNARSLWRLDHTRTKWSAGFFAWGTTIRLRHVTTGRFLGIAPPEPVAPNQAAAAAMMMAGMPANVMPGGLQQNYDVVLLAPHEATAEATVFYIKQTKDDKKRGEEHEEEGMGEPDLRVGETLAYLQHVATGRWLSYETFETKKRGRGRFEEKRAVLLVEGHMDDVFSLVRGQDEEQKSAAAIRRSTVVFTDFIRALEEVIFTNQLHQVQANPALLMVIAQNNPHQAALIQTHLQMMHTSSGSITGGQAGANQGIGSSGASAVASPGSGSTLASSQLSLTEVTQCLEDLIEFFSQPPTNAEHEVRQARLAALINRQDLFQASTLKIC